MVGAPAIAVGADEFKAHFDRARECYGSKDYDCAVQELKAAYKIKPLTALLLNIGHAYLDWGRPEQARDHYDLYLADKSLSPQARAEGEKYRSDAQKQLEAQQAAQQAAAQNPVPTPDATPAATPAPTPAPVAAKKSGPPVGPLVLMSTGAALLIVGLGLGGGALGISKDVVQGDGDFNNDLDSRGRALNSAGIAFDVLGGLSFAAGAAWGIGWLVKTRRDPSVTPIASLRIRPSAAGLLVLGRF